MDLNLSYTTFSCGAISAFPVPIANLIATVIGIIKIVTPIVLIVMGLIDMAKAVTKQKDDEIKKAQSLFIKRIISGVLVFFIISAVQLVFGVVSDASSEDSYMKCLPCFVNGVTDSGVCK